MCKNEPIQNTIHRKKTYVFLNKVLLIMEIKKNHKIELIKKNKQTLICLIEYILL